MGFDITPENQEEKMKRLSQIVFNLNDEAKKFEITMALVEFQSNTNISRMKYDLEIIGHYKELSTDIDKIMGWAE